MKVAVVGAGGREHAIVKKIKTSPLCEELYCIPGNGGIAEDAVCVPIKPTDISGIVEFASKNNIDYVIVAPDDPLVMGLVDALAIAGIPAFGPNKAAAQIEGSKLFAKQLMEKFNIPTAKYGSFTTSEEAMEYIENSLGTYPVVIKADGLALGKGVVICEDKRVAEKTLHEMLEERIFGESGTRVVVEEFLTGPEVSVLAFADGKTLVPMVSSMDHKRVFDGDKGLNTGGMGAIAPSPFYTEEIEKQCQREIFMPTLQAMEKIGAPFKGCLYFGLMLTPNGPKVIEYNCRFGDPETQVVLPLLKSDLLWVMLACTNGILKEEMVEFSKAAAACVVMASGGYPEKYETGITISGLDKNTNKSVTVYHSGTRKLNSGEIVSAGGRVLGVSATGATLSKALETTYSAIENIQFKKCHYRKDIGKKAIEETSLVQ